MGATIDARKVHVDRIDIENPKRQHGGGGGAGSRKGVRSAVLDI
jgi:hypothetical protein